MRRTSLTGLLLLLVAGIMLVFYVQGERNAYSYSHSISARRGVINHAPTGSASNSTAYIYYTLKQSTGFVLARAPKGGSGQPLGNPQAVAHFSNGFGLAETDNVLVMQLSPDGRYLAIDGTSDHGEQVWVYNPQQMILSLTPAYVFGNFLHWISGHSFLYRPMLPQGPAAPMDGNNWNPGLWVVDAATGAHRNIDIHMPSAYLVDAVASPDATHIIYSTSAGLGMGSDTWLMNSNGSGITHLFSNPSGAVGASLAGAQ